MKLNLVITQQELEELIADHVNSKLPAGTVDKVELFVKSKQNYRATWEHCHTIVLNEEARQEHNAKLAKATPESSRRRHYQRYRLG
jgi:hypothetical protein